MLVTEMASTTSMASGQGFVVRGNGGFPGAMIHEVDSHIRAHLLQTRERRRQNVDQLGLLADRGGLRLANVHEALDPDHEIDRLVAAGCQNVPPLRGFPAYDRQRAPAARRPPAAFPVVVAATRKRREVLAQAWAKTIRQKRPGARKRPSPSSALRTFRAGVGWWRWLKLGHRLDQYAGRTARSRSRSQTAARD